MAAMKQCPVCGSQIITIDGVLQKKKGFFYYLSGNAMSDLGCKSGFKTARLIAGKGRAEDIPNAECLACHHKWVEKKRREAV